MPPPTTLVSSSCTAACTFLHCFSSSAPALCACSHCLLKFHCLLLLHHTPILHVPTHIYTHFLPATHLPLPATYALPTPTPLPAACMPPGCIFPLLPTVCSFHLFPSFSSLCSPMHCTCTLSLHFTTHCPMLSPLEGGRREGARDGGAVCRYAGWRLGTRSALSRRQSIAFSCSNAVCAIGMLYANQHIHLRAAFARHYQWHVCWRDGILLPSPARSDRSFRHAGRQPLWFGIAL